MVVPDVNRIHVFLNLLPIRYGFSRKIHVIFLIHYEISKLVKLEICRWSVVQNYENFWKVDKIFCGMVNITYFELLCRQKCMVKAFFYKCTHMTFYFLHRFTYSLRQKILKLLKFKRISFF